MDGSSIWLRLPVRGGVAFPPDMLPLRWLLPILGPFPRASTRGGVHGFEVLYLGEDKDVCELEVGAMLGSPLPGKMLVPNPKGGSWTFFAVDVQLQRVADLCRPRQRKLLVTTAQELTGDWAGYAVRSPKTVFKSLTREGT